MFCPLLTLAMVVAGGGGGSMAGCMKEGCAWWEKGQEVCVVKAIGWALLGVVEKL